MRPHERIAEKHGAIVDRVVALPLTLRGGEVFRLAWTENVQGRWNTEDRETVRWAAYDLSGDWQGVFTRRTDAIAVATHHPEEN